MKKETELHEQIRLLEREVKYLSEAIDSVQMDLKEQTAKLRIELATLKAFLTQVHPDFKTRYPKIKKTVTASVDPDRFE